MANKLLETLTIDGTSMDILNDRMPKMYQEYQKDGFNISSSMTYDTWFTATEDGLMWGTLNMRFERSTTTTQTYKIAVLQVYRDGRWIDFIQPSITSAQTDANTSIHIPFIAKVLKNDIYRVGYRIASDTLSSSNNSLRVKWIFVPDVVGG